ncbi:MAG: sugar ABC transporter permease [Hyphomicrobiales bacterium]|nr:sugar ABC transporter permease [Hyphomicrobiales bacterium]
MSEIAATIGAGEPVARVRSRVRDMLTIAPFLAPTFLLLAAFTYWPVAVAFRDAFTSTDGGTSVVGLDNFRALFGDPAFRKAAWNNLLYAIATVPLTLALALAFALALVRSARISGLLRTVFFLPTLIPLIAAASIFLFLFLPQAGLIDHYLAKIGRQGPNWLGDPDIALWSLCALTIWKNAGYYMLFFLAGLQGVSRDLIEAATLDGAGPAARLRHVTLPALKETFAFVLILALIGAITQVDHIFVLTKGGPSDSTNLILFYIYQEAVEQYEPGRAAAATVVALVVLLGITATSIRRFDREPGAAT